MNNLNDMEKFDSVFREAANNYELPFNQEAWILMQQKLDGKAKRRFGFWWWLPIGVIAIALGIFMFTPTAKKTNNAILENVSKNTSSSNTTTTLTNENVEHLTTEKTNKAIKNITETKVDNIEIKQKNDIKIGLSKTQITKTNPLKNIEKQYNRIDKPTQEVSLNNNSTIPKNATTSSTKIDKNYNNLSSTNSITTLEKITNTNSLTKTTHTANILYLHNRYLLNFNQIEKDNIGIVAKREEATKKLIEEEKRPMVRPVYLGYLPSNRLYLSASIANNIGYTSNPQLKNSSLQYKLEFGYNISKHTSIQTGISFGNRQFNMRKDQFTFKGPGALDKYVRDINADISLFEIPINMRYQYSNKENFGWFSTVGFSSVFLKKENYLVTIEKNGIISYLPQNFENTTSMFSMLNLSLGYQLPIAKNFTLTIEPYLQLPFKVIGEGGSKISSTGLQITGKYNFSKKK